MSTDLKLIKNIDGWDVEYLAEGQYALAYDTKGKDGSPLILKWMRPNPAEQVAPERFKNEEWILKKIDHPCFPKYINSGIHLDRPYIVMSRGPGESIKRMMQERQKEGSGATFGEVRVLNILIKIFEGLHYLHEQNIIHRDIKDDNIITNNSDSDVTIVDLGVSYNEKQPNKINTFRGGVGASRYCPPSKLEFNETKFSHDIFAVGVIGYLLLTSHYPWEVPPDSNTGELSELMRNVKCKDIKNYNVKVSKEVATFIQRLLIIKDEERPNALDALKEAEKIRQQLKERTFKKTPSHFPNVTLDPLYGDIRMTDFEWKLINTPEFQKLRRIKQLGFTNLVYYGADHSRFSHAIGTLHIAQRIIDSIEVRGEFSFSHEEKLTIRGYALLHDVTHIAFGHTLEDELNFFKRHDENSGRVNNLIFSENSNIGTLLRMYDYGREILSFFDFDSVSQKNWMTEIVESPFGADVLDYINRDAYYCGLYHKIDPAIFRRLSISRPTSENKHFASLLHSKHGLRIDAEFAIETLLRERYALFLKVYSHSTKIAAGAMLGKALFYQLQTTKSSFIHDLQKLGDEELLIRLSISKTKAVKDISTMLLNRSLYKPVYRAKLLSTTHDKDLNTAYNIKIEHLQKIGIFDPDGRDIIETRLAEKAKLPPEKVIVYCSPKAPGIQKVIYHIETQIPGESKKIDDSAFHLEYMRKHLGLWFVYVFVHPSCSEDSKLRLANAAREFFGNDNDLKIERKQAATLFE